MSMQWRVVGIAVIGFALAGCAPSVSRMQPMPVRGQAELQRDRDVAQCGAFATKDRPDDGGQDARFAACMVSRGYRVTLPVRVGLEHGRVDVEAPGASAVAQVENDLREGVGQVERVGQRTSSGEVVASRIGGLYRSNEPDRAHTARSEALEREFVPLVLGDRRFAWAADIEQLGRRLDGVCVTRGSDRRRARASDTVPVR